MSIQPRAVQNQVGDKGFDIRQGYIADYILDIVVLVFWGELNVMLVVVDGVYIVWAFF